MDLTKSKYAKYVPELEKAIAVPGHSRIAIARELVAAYPNDGIETNGVVQFMKLQFGNKEKVVVPFAAVTKNPTDLVDKLKTALKRRDVNTLESLSDVLDLGMGKVRQMLQDLKDAGHNIKIDNDVVLSSVLIPKADVHKLSVSGMTANTYKIGVCGDNHMGSKYERMDVLNALYDLYEEEGITTVFNTGNWIDGEARFNKNDLNVHGMGNQLKYFIKHYPQRSGITTHYIAGDDHEGWYVQREGVEIGKVAHIMAKEAGRTDLNYLGYMEADVEMNGTRLRVLHPGGGSSYAISYTTQKIIESYTESEKPHILVLGHYHKADYIFCRGVHAVQSACTMDQSPFMRKKRLAAHVGGWSIEFSTDELGNVIRFKPEFIPFFDNKYYKPWKHQ